jgi:hypothetical protein
MSEFWPSRWERPDVSYHDLNEEVLQKLLDKPKIIIPYIDSFRDNSEETLDNHSKSIN